MKFTRSKIPDVWLIEQERFADERGFFANTWSTDEFAAHGLNPALVQCCTSFNLRRGTLRGMHYQAEPHGQDKLVRCTRGAVFDVAIDLRPDSSTYRQWLGLELSETNGQALYIPRGFAHGFQTLADNTEVFYQMAQPYHAGSGKGVRWNDPAFKITWPITTGVTLAERDATYPNI